MKDNTLGALEADKASAVAVLHGLHVAYVVEELPIDVISSSDNKIRVVINCEAERGSIVLPPCIPKQSRVSEDSEHPHASKLVITKQVNAHKWGGVM